MIKLMTIGTFSGIRVDGTFSEIDGKKVFWSRESNYFRLTNTSTASVNTISVRYASGLIPNVQAEVYKLNPSQVLDIEIGDYIRYGNTNGTLLFLFNDKSPVVFKVEDSVYWDNFDSRQQFPTLIPYCGIMDMETPFYIPLDRAKIRVSGNEERVGDYNAFTTVDIWNEYLWLDFRRPYIVSLQFGAAGIEDDFAQFSLVYARQDCENYVQLNWVGDYGLKKSWFFEVQEERRVVDGSLQLQNILGYDVRKSYNKEMTLVFRDADYLQQVYLRDLISSSDVELIEVTDAQFTALVNITTSDIAITQQRKDITIKVKVQHYDTF